MSRRIYYAEGGGPLGGAYTLIELEVERETEKSYLLANNGRGEALVGARTYVGRTLRKSTLGGGQRVFEKPRPAVEWLRECMEAELRRLRLRQERVEEQSARLLTVLLETQEPAGEEQ